MVPNEIAEGIAAIDSLEGVTLLGEPYQRDANSTWVLKIRLRPDAVEDTAQVPPKTDWYVHLDEAYPWGTVRIYPAKENSITATFPHQQLNVAGGSETLWRKGHICVDRYGHTIGRSGATSEPTTADERLEWYLRRALNWLEAASKGELRREGEPYEIPAFNTDAAPGHRLAFNETHASFEAWQGEIERWGTVELSQLTNLSETLVTGEFRNTDGEVVHQPDWGDYVQANIEDDCSGAWVLLRETPFEPPWEAPETWNRLAEILSKTSIDLFELRADIEPTLEDETPRVLLVGFPVPETVGDSPVLIHWQAVELLEFENPSALQGSHRDTDRGRQRAAKLGTGKKSIRWLNSENWAYDQLSRRGNMVDSLTGAKVLLIGAGALGSELAECLVRDGCRHVTVVDGERFEIGNVARHTLSLRDVGSKKATAVAERLRSLSPHVRIVDLPEAFPPNSSFPSQAVDSADVVIDCTASNAVLHALDETRWDHPVLFCSASMGRCASRLFCFTACSYTFPHRQFEQEFEPWQLREQIERRPDEDAVPERVGCWHPASVIQDARIKMWAGIVAQLLDQETAMALGDSEFTVLETGDGLPTVTEAEPPFQAVETWATPDSSLTVEVSTECLDAMKDLCAQADEVETGGILAGTDIEGTTARILRATDPPRDSIQEPTQFHRGSEGVDEWLEEARASMGIHYLGEWHYHPRASPEASGPDRREMNDIATNEEYARPHPLLFIIGGHASEQFTVNAYLFHRDGEPEELQQMTSQPEETNGDDSLENSPDTAASDGSRGDDQ